MTNNITINLDNIKQKDFTFLQMAYDSKQIIELLNRIKNSPIVTLGMIPFISLFCYETIEVLKNYKIDLKIPENKTFSLQDIRLKTKLFENEYSKSKNIILNCDYFQDYIFKVI